MTNVIDLSSAIEDKQMIESTAVDSVANRFFEEEMKEEEQLDLEQIQRGIQRGLDILEKQIELWSVEEDNNVRTLRSIKGTRDAFNSLYSLVQVIGSDLTLLIKNQEAQIASHFTTQAHLQTLIETLKDNAIVTDKELEATWNRIVPKPEDIDNS